MKIIILCILFLLVLSGCSAENVCDSQEVSRETSPDRVVDGVITKINCGATAGYSYRVYITLSGKQPTENSVFLADKVDSIKVEWDSSKKLTITYQEARIFEFTNFWQSAQVDEHRYTVSVVERRVKPVGWDEESQDREQMQY